MVPYDYLQGCILLVLVLLITPTLGAYLAAVFTGKRHPLTPVLGWLERATYRLGAVDTTLNMDWKQYLTTLLYFNGLGLVALFILLLVQGWLPLNPQHLKGVPWDLALNTAVSFVTTTNWQAYTGETTMSYLTQMLGLAVQNFLSAATGLCVLLALIRGIRAREDMGLGNFWMDITRAIIYVLLPLSLLLSLTLVSQGVMQTFGSYVEATTLEGDTQVLPRGPVASQIAIKQLGTNGGGFFGANSAHPFENPTPASDFLEMLAILLLPCSITYMYGKMLHKQRQGWMLLGVIFLLVALGFFIMQLAESALNPITGALPNLEGKELRFGVFNSIMWANITTSTASGSVNTIHTSLTPLAGGMAILNIMLGELTFGGLGVGLCGMLMFTFLTVFIAGLMVGRTPEFLGKKIERNEILWVILAILMPCFLTLTGAGIASVLPVALASLSNLGPHGLSTILYAFTSTAGNNGSAFSDLQANTVFYNISLAVVMLMARLAIIVPSLAIAGCLATKKYTPPSSGSFHTDNMLFGILLFCVIVIVGVLAFFPALALGPIIEYLLMLQGRTF